MGRNVEEPVRALFDAGHNAIGAHIKANGADLLYRWLALISIKTHLRDATFAWNKDRRDNVGSIGDVYDWIALHHIHAVARSIREGMSLGRSVVGTFVALPALQLKGDEHFDFGDMYAARAILLRSGRTALIAVLNDASAAQIVYADNLRKITAPVSSPQLREILSQFAFINLHLTSRPKFSTELSGERFSIVAELPAANEMTFDWSAEPSLGKVMSYVCGPLLAGAPAEKRSLIEQGLATGRWSWMFDGEGNFRENGDHEE
jgi:hypothetical protein